MRGRHSVAGTATGLEGQASGLRYENNSKLFRQQLGKLPKTLVTSSERWGWERRKETLRSFTKFLYLYEIAAQCGKT